MNDIFEVIGNGLKDDIEKAFKPIVATLWFAIREGWHLEIKQIVVPKNKFDTDELPIGNIKLNPNHISCHGLVDYHTNDKALFTRIEYADPEMSRKICEAVYKMLYLAGQWKMMRDVMKVPVPNLEDE